MSRHVLAIVLAMLATLPCGGVALAEKTPDLGKTKFKDIAKFLNLRAEQQGKIKLNVERIQDIVKDANKQRGWGGGGRRVPIGGSGGFGRPGANGGPEVVSPGKVEERRVQRKEWQTEIDNRVEEIKSFLDPAQLEKFKAIRIPDLALPQ